MLWLQIGWQTASSLFLSSGAKVPPVNVLLFSHDKVWVETSGSGVHAARYTTMTDVQSLKEWIFWAKNSV